MGREVDGDGAEAAKRKKEKEKKIRPRKWGERWTATELR